MTFRNGLKSFVLVFVWVVAFAPAAWAQEEPPVVKALYDTFAELGGERPSHKSLTTGSDGTITITGLKLLMQNYQQDGEDVRQELVADEVIISDIKSTSEGFFEAGSLMMKNSVISVTTPEIETFKMIVPVMQAKGAYIRSPETLKTNLDRVFAQSFLAREFSAPLVTLSAGEWSLDVHDAKFTWNGDPKTFMGETIYSVGGIELPASTLDELGMQPSLKELGYDALVIGVTGRANMKMPAAHLEIDGDSSVLARDMGAFTTSGAVGGIQPALLEAAQAVQETPNSIDMGAMMAMLQSITIGHIKIRYDDVSLAERLLTYFEKLQKKSRAEIVADSVAMSEFGLVGLSSPELSAQSKAALETFLTKPGWIEFELRPDVPIAASQIMPLLGTPAEIVKLLKVKITAGAAE